MLQVSNNKIGPCKYCKQAFKPGEQALRIGEDIFHANCAAEVAKLQETILKEEAKTCYWKYVKYTHSYDKEFLIAKFQIYICDCIDKLLKNELLNSKGEPYEGITVSQPAQTGKSRTITETAPSYFLGKNPYKHVIEVSYGDDLAVKFGRRNRQKIEEFGKELFGIELSKDSSAAIEFEIAGTKGGMISRGIGAAITGNPADLIVVDDPYKNRTDADSPSYKKFVIEEWLNTIRTRASAKCKFIVVHTRWNEDDLIGYLLSTEPDKWFEIRFPLEAEEYEEITGRQPGDSLLPEAGKDNTWLKKFKTSFINDPSEGGLRAWNALMQQRPTSLEGNMIKRTFWREYKLSLKMQRGEGLDEMLQSWDCTFKDTDGTDFVAGGVVGRAGVNCYIMDVINERMGIVKTMESMIAMARKWPEATLKLIEDKANGPAVIEMLENKVPGIVAVKATKSKGERVNAVLPLWEGGNVYIPSEIETSEGIWVPCPWKQMVIDQCSAFRPDKKVQKDDIIDMISQALNKLMYNISIAAKELPSNGYWTVDELKDMGYKPYEIREIVKKMNRSWEKPKEDAV